MPALTLYSELDLGRERFRRHVVGRRTSVDGIVVARHDREAEHVLGTIVAARVREVILLAVTVPVDLRQRVAAA